MTLAFFTSGSPRKQPRRQRSIDADFIPQAILNKDIVQVARVLNLNIEENSDDLDKFEEVTFLSSSTNIPIAIRHYAGHPKGTVTMYLPFKIRDIDAITKAIALVVEELRFSTEDIYWQRKDDPEL
jgi:hypothetical protein